MMSPYTHSICQGHYMIKAFGPYSRERSFMVYAIPNPENDTVLLTDVKRNWTEVTVALFRLMAPSFFIPEPGRGVYD